MAAPNVPGFSHMPSEFKAYFWNNPAGGCDFDLKWTIINDMGFLKTVLVGPIPQYGIKKFMNFLVGSWDSKRIREIPGVGNTFAMRMETNLGPYCSVRQLYHIFYSWAFDEAKFWRFLYWACNAGTIYAGDRHMTRAVAGFTQKHILFTNPSANIKVGDPFPFSDSEE